MMCNCNGIQYCVYCIRKRYSWIRENITLYLRGYPKNSVEENTENSNTYQDETDDDSEFKPEYSLNDTVSPIPSPADDEKEKKKQQNLANEKENKQKLNLAISPDYIWEFFPFFIFRKNVKRIIVIFVKKCKKCKAILEYDFIEL